MGAQRTIEPAYRSWLDHELGAWEQSGIITQPQARAILAQYETSEELASQRRNWFLYALWGCAAVLVGAAAFLLVGFNWEQLPAAAKLAIIFGVLSGTYALAFFLRLKLGWMQAADLVFLLGGLFYGAAIWLVAQVFHIDAHYPDGFFWWAVGLLPLALLLDSVLIHALLVAVLGAWISSEVLGFGHLPGLLFGYRWPWLPNGAYWAVLMILPGLWWCYRRQSFWGVTLYVPLLAWWAILQPLAWHWYSAEPYFVGAVGAALLIAAESHPPGNPLAIPFRLFGALLLGGALVPLSFYDFHRYAWNGNAEFTAIGTAIVICAWSGLAIAASEWLRFHYLERGQDSAANLVDDIRRRQWAPLAMAASIAVLALLSVGGHESSQSAALLPTLLANAAIVGTSLWLMSVGLRDDRATPFIGGVLYFLLWVVMRYIDLFGNAGGMLGAAGLFFLCGLALAGVAWFWRERKQVLHVQ